MLQLAIDRTNRVLLVSISGLMGSRQLDEADWAVADALIAEPLIGGAIFDYSRVEAFAFSQGRLITRAQTPPIVQGTRVFVRPTGPTGDAIRAYSEYQREAGQRQPIIVETLEEACRILGLVEPDFRPIELH